MKNFYFLTILALIFTVGCNPKVETEPVDLNAVNDTIEQLINEYQNAWNAEDVDMISALASDDGRFFGSDPSEVLDKTELLKMCMDLFADTVDYSYDVNVREIMPAANGESALVVEHINMVGFSSLMQMRQTCQFVKIEDSWKVNYISWGMLANNDDVAKLNAALE